MNDLVRILNEAVVACNEGIQSELSKEVIADVGSMVETTPADISSRYWLMQFLEPLSRKELKSVVDGFLIQLLVEEQAKKLVKFLMIRFPQYYSEDISKAPMDEGPEARPSPQVPSASPSPSPGPKEPGKKPKP